MSLPPSERCLPIDTQQAAEELVDRLVAELTASWQLGHRLRSEELLRQHDGLSAYPQTALRLIFEEVYLAEAHGVPISIDEAVGRFPQWAEQLRVMLDCQHLLGLNAVAPLFPGIGELLDDFSIVAELGRGGQGRVFLARQNSLAGRPLVLKITPCEGEEHLSLARLQHTHIAPLYWAQNIPERNLRVLCMPFLGVVTLAALPLQLASTPPCRRSGRDLRRLLDEANGATAIALPASGPDCERLSGLAYVSAVCWLGACLADALHYAHQRGLVHLDIKPSNVLLAADGQPLILDFHLARAPIAAGEMDPAWLGGTPDYLSPEHDAALSAAAVGEPIPGKVDGRSDQYALGLVLYELLGGERGGNRRPEPQGLPRANPQVSVGLSDILARCLAADPERRYPDAAALAADLRHHLDDLPLQGVANRSVRERWAKWRRRRPYALPFIACVLMGLAALMVGEVLGTRWLVERQQNAEAALAQGQEHLHRGEFDEAALAFERGKEQASGYPGAGQLARALDLHLTGARRGGKAMALHKFADQLRFHAVLEPLPPRIRLFVDGSRHFWQERESLGHKADFPLEESLEQALRADLLDVALLSTDRGILLAPAGQADRAHREALAVLGEAEALFGPSAALARHRWASARALGDAAVAHRLEQNALDHPPRTAWDHYALGRFWLLQGAPTAAAPELERAVAIAPVEFLPHFYRGTCAFRQKDYPRAIAEFTFCAGRSPSAEAFFHRCRAYSAAGQREAALQDCHVALKLDPAHTGARQLQKQLAAQR
jgi:eukaryotic-like serine/threonine-protein kinase